MKRVSVIITVFNGSKWIDSCFDSILKQNIEPVFRNRVEVVVFDDASNDDTFERISDWTIRFRDKWLELIVIRSDFEAPKGVGYGRNMAVAHSSGDFLCFQDIDDVMMPNRIQTQLTAALQLGKNVEVIIGSKFTRMPLESTVRFTKWANNLPSSKLDVQIFTSNGPTIIMPTWFMHRKVFEGVGGFCEDGSGTPEDLIFFYKHLNLGGQLCRVDEILLQYTYHAEATSFSVKSETIDKIRLQQLIKAKLKKHPKWRQGFMIWNAGRQGRKFYRSLPEDWQLRVKSFCDVDPKLIGTTFNHYDPEQKKTLRNVPIVSYKEVKPPVIICMKLDLTDGAFEENLESMEMVEGRDYVLFS